MAKTQTGVIDQPSLVGSLELAREEARQLSLELQSSLAYASSTESLIILPYIQRAATLARDINALRESALADNAAKR